MVNFIELRKAIINMTPRQYIYKLLKEELIKQDHWKNKERGNPQAGYKAMKIREGLSNESIKGMNKHARKMIYPNE